MSLSNLVHKLVKLFLNEDKGLHLMYIIASDLFVFTYLKLETRVVCREF